MNYFKRLLVIIFISFSLSYLIFVFFKIGLCRYQVHNNDRLSEILTQKTKHNILFVGSSRTHFSINPRIIDSICKVDSYNAGIEGGNIYEFEMILKAYLENHPPPDYLFLSIDLHSFSDGVKMFNYPVYFPFASKNKTIKNYLYENGYLSSFKEILPFLQITDYDDNTKGFFFKSILGQNEIPNGDFQYKGYLSNTDVIVDSTVNVSNSFNLVINKDKINCLNRFVDLCKERKINLIFYYPPEYKSLYLKSVINSSQIFKLIQNISIEHNISFFRDDSLSLSNVNYNFANVSHLNKNGSYNYSLIISQRLHNILKN